MRHRPAATDTHEWRAGHGPAWFDISRYKETGSLEAGQWAELLGLRRDAWRIFPSNEPDDSGSNVRSEVDLQPFRQLVGLIRKNPLLSGYPFASDPEAARLAAAFFGRFVRQADVGDLVSSLSLLGEKSEVLLSAWRTGNAGNFYPKDPAVEQSVWTQNIRLGNNGRVLLSVDLNADIRDIKRQFDELITNLQARRPKAKHLEHRPQCDLIHRNRLLPYLDLHLWEIETGQKITWEEMLSTVFGEDSGVQEVDAFRKFVTKYAKAVFEGNLIQRLQGSSQNGVPDP